MIDNQADNPGWRALASAIILQAIADTRQHDISAQHYLLVGPAYDFATSLVGLSTPVWIWRRWVLDDCRGKPPRVPRKFWKLRVRGKVALNGA